MRLDYHNYISKIQNKFVNIDRRYKIFSVS